MKHEWRKHEKGIYLPKKEPESFRLMQAYCDENNLERKKKSHREIYLNDARKVEAEKLKTVLRFEVAQ